MNKLYGKAIRRRSSISKAVSKLAETDKLPAAWSNIYDAFGVVDASADQLLHNFWSNIWNCAQVDDLT